MRKYLIVIIIVFCRQHTALAQFSPGELSRAHIELEGINKCADCHEVGKEISGQKCLTCHKEIQKELDVKRGYHFVVSTSTCVTCHKEHFGRSARITAVDRTTFDHEKTGYPLTGKHASTKCEDCHAPRNIKSAEALQFVQKGRKTFLGLTSACNACHEDRHRGVYGKECKTCHSTSAWKTTLSFDHSKTEYPLEGKHSSVACDKCHTEALLAKDVPRTSTLSTKSFADCAPCHTSPHSPTFSTRSCSSCHHPNGWREARGSRTFNHDLTAFKLLGRHADVKCEECHKVSASTKLRLMRPAHARCTDCHADYHRGEFREKYGNDCVKCHDEHGFQPSKFTLAEHQRSRFPLEGAHPAVPCARCHANSKDDRTVFRFASLKCEECHKDAHGGQFKALNCSQCHITEEWKKTLFDHSKTKFPLTGKHAAIVCSECHKPSGKSTVVQYKGLTTKCEPCHEEPHAKQFAVRGSTDCAPCHTAISWKSLLFDHEKQSSFSLTGAHQKVPCGLCHRQERINNKMTARYKPLPSKCESCHGQKEMMKG